MNSCTYANKTAVASWALEHPACSPEDEIDVDGDVANAVVDMS